MEMQIAEGHSDYVICLFVSVLLLVFIIIFVFVFVKFARYANNWLSRLIIRSLY